MPYARICRGRMSGMKHHRVILLTVLIVILSINSLNVHNPSTSIIRLHNFYPLILADSYTPHTPIVITSNNDFIIQGWPGNGTKENPYTIQNLSIVDDSICIDISNTTANFQILSCLISSSTQSDNNGISFENVINGSIIDCIIENHLNGVYLFSSSFCTINSSIATNNGHSGIELLSSDSCSLYSNSASDGLCGFWVESSFSNILSNNTASNADYGFILYLSSSILQNNTAYGNMNGFHIYESSFCDLTNCTANNNSVSGFFLYNSSFCVMEKNSIFFNDGHGFYLVNSTSCTIINNTLRDNGIYLNGPSVFYWLHNISDNSINGLPFKYFKSVSNLSIDGIQYGQVLLANCSNLSVKNGLFVDVSIGVQLGFCLNCTLDNITTVGSAISGIDIFHSPNCNLINNSVIDSSNFGFHIESSSNCNLSHNIATNSHRYGFYLFESPSCHLFNNTSTKNGMNGFSLINTSYSILIKNSAQNNRYDGYYHGYSNGCMFTDNFASNNNIGFSFSTISNCTLTFNNATKNDLYGFYLGQSSSCILHNNSASSNDYGIFIGDYSEENLLYFNYIFMNNVSNGYDDGELNSWDNGTYGNYWDDYDTSGVYNIPGEAQSVDNHPFLLGEPPYNGNTTTPITSTTIDTVTTTTTGNQTNTTNQSNLLIRLLLNGIAISSATVIVIVLILTIRARRLSKASAP